MKKIVSYSEAKAQGLPRYYTGKPCPRGHIAERRTASRGCSECELEKVADWRARNPDKVKEANARRTPEQQHLRFQDYYAKNGDRLRAKARAHRRVAYYRDQETEVARSVAYRKNNLAKVQARLRRWRANKLATDVVFRLKTNLRRRINKVLRGQVKTGSAIRDLGCSVAELREWLEARFLPGMTWENYGPVWHVDHKEPLAAFDLADPAQFARTVHYTNLQPLFAQDNHWKGPRHRPSRVND
jgi:hypothetical protein